MTIIIGILVPAILFLITLPLQSFLFLARQHLKLKEKEEKKRGKGSLKKSLGFSDGSARLRARLGISKKNDSCNKKSSKFKQLSLKAQRLMIKTLSSLITLLRVLASNLICIVCTAFMIMIPVVSLVIVATAGIVMFLNTNEGSATTFGNIVSQQFSENNTGVAQGVDDWLSKCGEMAHFYIDNVARYEASNEATAMTSCDLVDGKNVRADCTGYMYACLVYAGYIADSPSNANSATQWYQSKTIGQKIESAGFTWISAGQGFEWQKGDIAVISGHVELIEDVKDGKVRTWGWGSVKTVYPKGEQNYRDMTTFNYKDNQYYDGCWRLVD